MKKGLIIIISSFFFLVGCQQSPKENPNELKLNIPQDLPTSLEGMKAMLSEVKMSQKQLEQFAQKLEGRVGELDTTEIKAMLVTAIKAAKTDYRHYVEIQANVVAQDPVMASSETGGRVLEMPWKEGQYINKGDLVARVDLNQADRMIDSQVAELRTQLSLARTVYQRQKRLWDQNIGSEIQYLQAKNNVERLEKGIATAQSQKREAVAYAPASGTIEKVMVRKGEMSGPGSPILMIVDRSEMKVVADVPELHLKNVRVGESVKVTFPSLDEEKTARVSEIGRMINPSNRTFGVEVRMPNARGYLKPYLQSVMHINDKTIKNAVMIPEQLLRQDVIGNDYVYVVEQQGADFAVAKKTIVETGESAEGKVVITKGLQGGEIIIDRGGRGLSDGQRIEVTMNESEETSK